MQRGKALCTFVVQAPLITVRDIYREWPVLPTAHTYAASRILLCNIHLLAGFIEHCVLVVLLVAPQSDGLDQIDLLFDKHIRQPG